MSKSPNRAKAALCIFLTAMMVLAGCGSGANSDPAAADISKLSPAGGFLATSVEESGGFIAGTDKKETTSNYAYLYDNAIALIALCGEGADRHAQKIADAIVFAQGHDRTFHDGRLRNAYVSGDPKSDSGRSITNREVTIRLPGFWQDGSWQEDAYAVSTATGNMGWAILSLCAAAQDAPADKRVEYVSATTQAADFILTLQSPEGGFTAGYEGWDDAQVKVSYKSTEHNISLIAAFRAAAEVIAEQDATKAAAYRAAAEHARSFVLSMYDPQLQCFYTGTENDGTTVSTGVIPLDANTLAVLALFDEFSDTYDVLSFIENRMAVGDGFDFSAGDLDGIWNEGTAQMAVCYSLLGDTEKYDTIMKYLKTQSAKDGSVPAADRDGVSWAL